jgi:S1-C subfamily serine protease
MGRIEKTVFLSYRRTDGAWALSIYGWLTHRGYDVFIDYDNIASGAFASVIVENILARAHFLVILSPTALDRCEAPGDWLRREIETAMRHGRNVVPLLVDGFSFRAPNVARKLTGLLSHLAEYNGLEVSLSTFPDKMHRLSNRFLNIALSDVIHPPGVMAVQVDNAVHPASEQAVQVAKQQQAKADAAPPSQPSMPQDWTPPPLTSRWKGPTFSRSLEIVRLKPTWAAIAVTAVLTLVVSRSEWLGKHIEIPWERSNSQAMDPVRIAAIAKKSVVRVRVRAIDESGQAMEAWGTGFFVSVDGRLVTAGHLVPKNGVIEISSDPEGPWHRVVVVQTDSALDVALLKRTTGGPTKALPLAKDNPKLGEALTIAGWVADKAGGMMISAGNVVTTADAGYTTNADARLGLSGAPVFNSEGKVVGMVRGVRVDEPLSTLVVPVAIFSPFVLGEGR